MSAVAFDSLEYAQQLEAAGMPRAGMPRDQAEVVAKGLTAMFIHNFESLVTKDYLDARLGEMEATVDGRLAGLRLDMHREFEAVRADTAELRSSVSSSVSSTLKLHSWMLALLMAGIFVPLIRQILA